MIESPTDKFAESHDESGQTMAEYAVVLGVIVVAVVAALTLLGVAISGKLGDVTGVLTSPLPTS